MQLLEQTAAPGVTGVCTRNGFLGAQAISCTLQGRDLPSAGYVLEKPCPFTNRKPWPFFFPPGVNCSVGQCGLCVTVPVLGMVSALPLPQSWQRFRSLPLQKLFAGLRLFQFVCRLVSEGVWWLRGAEWAPASCQESGVDVWGVKHPSIPRPLQSRPSEAVGVLQRN